MLVRSDYGVEVFTFARNSIGERQLQITDPYASVMSDVVIVPVLHV